LLIITKSLQKLIMRKIYLSSIAIVFAFATLFTTVTSCNSKNETETEIEGEEENDKYDNPEAAAIFQLERTKDLTTGQIPEGVYMDALNETLLRKNIVANSAGSIESFNWIERGPYTDVVGPSNGNTRANSGITSGRIDAIMVDSSDATHKTLFAGGRGGGLWKTTDITASPATWTLVNDFLLNQSIAAICQDPTDFNIMYMATGESYGEGGAIRGNGVFKSTDHGVTWAQLASTTSYFYCTRILCDAAGNIYLGTNGNGLLRSTKVSGGAVWTNISPSAATKIADLEISSTGRLHVTTGIFSASSYRFTDNPATVNVATWTAPTTPYTAFNARCEIAVLGNTLYALPGNTAYQVPTIFKSTDGGDNWFATGGQPATGWASGQAWYGLTAVVNPSNADECIVGGLDQHKTTNGGTSWAKISAWVGNGGQYVHADSHQTLWFDGGTKIVFACDGGLHYSSDGGITIRDKNQGLRLKEFYSVAMHPTLPNYFLAGAQDNGTHQLNGPGLSSSVEVTGGDGAYVDIDQDEPQFQMGAYVYNNYRRSTNGGANWSSINFTNSFGQFINPFDYDDAANIMYCGYGAGNFLRWDNPQTGNTTTIVPVTNFNGGAATAMQASPYTANTVFFGTTNGRVVKVVDANSTLISEINITPAGMSGYVNSINVGISDQNLVATVTNYGVNNVWVSNNGGISWTAADGNLPNIPVYWALYNPDDNTKLIIATETGVWQTDLLNGAATNWVPDPTFPTVRTTMLKYRALDRAIGASTYGRGVWSTNLPPLSCNPVVITSNPANTSVCAGSNASFSITTTGSPTIAYQWYVSVAAGPFTIISGANAATYSFVTTAGQNGNQYRCVATGSCGVPLTQTSTAATLSVTAAPIITSHPANATICTGTNTSFSAVVTGGTTYKWQVSTNGGTTFTDVPNAAPYSNVTTTTLNITGATIALNTYQYRLVATTGTCSSNSNAATITVNNAAAITSQPINATVCTGSTATFSVIASGTGLTYQWYSSPTGTFGSFVSLGATATGASYTTAAVTVSTNAFYQVIVTSAGCPGTVTSTIAQLAINAVPTVSLVTTSQTVCAPATATYTCTAAGTGITYQWESAPSTAGPFTPVVGGTGANTNTYTTGATNASMSGMVYRLVVTGTCAPTATSAIATLTVNAAAAITTAPTAQTVCNGSTASFSVVATGSNLGYQWQMSTTGIGGTYSNVSTGGTAASYTTPVTIPANNGTYYRVVVTSAPCAPAVTSVPVLLTVNTVAVIGTQPTAQSACIPQTATFTVAATGTGLTYQWQLAPAGSTTFADIVGATSASYTTPATVLTMNGNQYRVNILSTCSPTTPTTSSAALLTVNNPVSITQQPTQQSGCTNDNYTFSVVASSPGNVLTYQWQISPTGNPGTFINIGTANSATYTINNAPIFLSGSFYRVYISVPCGTGISTDTSAKAKLLLINKPAIVLTKPITSNTNAFVNSSLFATVSPVANYTYTWTVNGTSIPNTASSTSIPLNVDASGLYKVSLKDVLTGCTVSDEIAVVATASDNLLKGKVFVYPNPVSTLMYVRFNTSDNTDRSAMVNIYDEKGGRVFSKAYTIAGTNGKMEVDMSKYPVGTYIVYVMDASGNKLGATKVVKVL
jgi:hypothetical protein